MSTRAARRDVPNILEFVVDPQLLDLSLSPAQETLLCGIYGLPLPTSDHLDLWEQCTGGRPYRAGHAYGEVTVIAGARGGKDSRILAPTLCYEAVFGQHERHLARGERIPVRDAPDDVGERIRHVLAREGSLPGEPLVEHGRERRRAPQPVPPGRPTGAPRSLPRPRAESSP